MTASLRALTSVGATALGWLRRVSGPVIEQASSVSEPMEIAAIDYLRRLRAEGRLGSPWLRDRLQRWFLPAWFLFLSLPMVVGYLTTPDAIGFDARLYMGAARVWLGGGDPWESAYRGVYFAAPPICLLPLVPLTILPEPFDWLTLLVLTVFGTAATVRALRLAWWWVLFPPVVQGTISGNAQMLLIPLILSGWGWLAGTLKVYAVVPLVFLGKWRQLLAFGVALAVSAPLLPWREFIEHFGTINATLQAQSGYGFPAVVSVLLLAPAMLAVSVIGRERGAWLLVPALWPSQQWYYASIALPVRSALAGFIIAIPVPGSGAIALFALAIYELLDRRDRRRRGAGKVLGRTAL